MDEYIQKLLRDQGITDTLEPDVRAQLISELTGRANDFLNRRLLDAMSDEAVEQFNKLLNEPSLTTEQVQNFITANVPNRDQVVAAALVEFRALYLGDKA